MFIPLKQVVVHSLKPVKFISQKGAHLAHLMLLPLSVIRTSCIDATVLPLLENIIHRGGLP